MKLRDVFIVSCTSGLLTLLVVVSMSFTYAQVRQSTNYIIEADSINFGGGLSSSTNYTLESTAGEVGTGDSSSANYNLRAGYQQMTTRFISMTAPASVLMSPSIPGITGGTANGTTSVIVTTDSAAGYNLSIRASQSPAMQKGADTISDYVPVGAPDFSFTVPAGDARLGYSPSGNDTVARFKDDGGACNTGVLETALACWDGLDTVAETIAQAGAANNPNGATTTVHFRVGLGSNANKAAGTYIATTTLTALPL